MNKPYVSAIMLVLNERFYIRASVYNTLQFVDEFLVMDGGSEDGTLEVLKQIRGEDSRLEIIVNPQSDTRHYHPSWDQPARWNSLIEKAKYSWIYVVGADECLTDAANLKKMICRHPDTTAFTFPRYAVTDRYHYTPNWFPDRQLRLFDRSALGGLRFKNIPRHCTIKAHMGTGPNPPKKPTGKYLVHYHHGFGPKKHRLGKGMRIEKLPPSFRHPKHAKRFIIKHPEKIDFKYDFRLYGKAGHVPR